MTPESLLPGGPGLGCHRMMLLMWLAREDPDAYGEELARAAAPRDRDTAGRAGVLRQAP